MSAALYHCTQLPSSWESSLVIADGLDEQHANLADLISFGLSYQCSYVSASQGKSMPRVDVAAMELLYDR